MRIQVILVVNIVDYGYQGDGQSPTEPCNHAKIHSQKANNQFLSQSTSVPKLTPLCGLREMDLHRFILVHHMTFVVRALR